MPTANPEVVMTKSENSVERVMVTTMTAAFTLKTAIELYDELGTAPDGL